MPLGLVEQGYHQWSFIQEEAHIALGFRQSQGTSKSCQGWTLGEVFQFGIEKGGANPKQLGAAANRIEERVSAKESLDGRSYSDAALARVTHGIVMRPGRLTVTVCVALSIGFCTV